MNYLADPGGRFESDTHRRVLGHLSYPDDNYGWTVPALVQRMFPDVGTNISSPQDMQTVLSDLEREGHAQRLSTEHGEVWRMTQQGLDILNGPNAEEPPPGSDVQGPAVIGATQISQSNPTPIGENGAGSNPS